MNDVEDALKLCAKLGINAITTCEEAFFVENSNPNLIKEIDDLAKEISRYLLWGISKCNSFIIT